MSGTLTLVTGTTFEPVTRTEAKVWLRLDESETAEDTLIDSLIVLARSRVESYARVSLLQQTYDYYLDEEPCDTVIDLPRAPVVSVTSIKAFQSSEQTDTGGTAMSSSDYYVDTVNDRVMPMSGATYPTATREINGFVIRFVAGYSTASTGVPDSAKTAIKQLVAYGYRNRGDVPDTMPAEIVETLSDFALPEWG